VRNAVSHHPQGIIPAKVLKINEAKPSLWLYKRIMRTKIDRVKTLVFAGYLHASVGSAQVSEDMLHEIRNHRRKLVLSGMRHHFRRQLPRRQSRIKLSNAMLNIVNVIVPGKTRQERRAKRPRHARRLVLMQPHQKVRHCHKLVIGILVNRLGDARLVRVNPELLFGIPKVCPRNLLDTNLVQKRQRLKLPVEPIELIIALIFGHHQPAINELKPKDSTVSTGLDLIEPGDRRAKILLYLCAQAG
jgi:hypothetical protein